jgi:hypothetical protein
MKTAPLHWRFAPMVLMEEFAEIQYCFETTRPIFLGRRRMIFSWRCTAGFVSDYSVYLKPETNVYPNPYVLDICCGGHLVWYKTMEKWVKLAITRNPRDNPFKGIPPWSDPKPFFNDPYFMEKMKIVTDLM